MATTQYIGARYVPLFYTNPNDGTNAWQAGVAYDPLTIVTDLNQSYTSKIPVPASVGRPSENPTYWIMTGAYSAQLEQYHQEVIAVQADVDDLQEEIETRTGKRRFILLGDSYGYGIQGSGQPWTTGWLSYCANTFDTDVYYLDQTTDPVEGTIGFTSTLPFLTVLQQIEQRTPIDSPETITDIVVIGGNNDPSTASEADIMNAVNAFCTYARAHYPNANIKIGVLGYNAKNLYEGNQMFSKYRAGANANGCAFISDLLMLAISPQYYSDGTHVNTAGYAFINPHIANAVLTGSCSYSQEYTQTLEQYGQITSFGQITYGLRVDWNNRAFSASVIDTTRNVAYPVQVTTPSTSGTLTLTAWGMSGNHIKLPKTWYPLSNTRRYCYGGSNSGIVAHGTMYLNADDQIVIGAGFYNNTAATGLSGPNQMVEWDYPANWLFI